jgi:hypothetical protein
MKTVIITVLSSENKHRMSAIIGRLNGSGQKIIEVLDDTGDVYIDNNGVEERIRTNGGCIIISAR